MKLAVFIIIELALSYFMAMQFCGKLEAASATRANKEDGTKTRSLELGHTGRAMLMVAIFIEFALIALLSKWLVAGTLVAMIISAISVLANVYLRGVGIEALVPMLLLWVGNIAASLFKQKVGAESRWATFYIIFEIVMLVFLLAGTAIVRFNRYRRMYMDEEDADDWEERKERIIRTVLNGLVIVLIIAVAVIIMYWLEVKFDFLPPHRA